MLFHRIFVLVPTAVAGVICASACGDDTTEPPSSEPPRPTTVAVTPATAELTALGATVQLNAEVRDQNGQVMAGVTVAWSSSAASVAAVSGSGLVTAVGNGAATITATAGPASGTATVSVAQTVSSVTVTPAADTLVVGDTLRLSAGAADANGHAVAGAEFTWASSDASVAAVDAPGLVRGIAEGGVTVTATSSGVTGSAELTVAAPVPTTVAVTPDTVAFAAIGQTAQLAAEVRDQAGRPMEVVAVSWSSADTMVAMVDSAGLVTAVGNGAATITATAGPASGTATVSVAQKVRSVTVTPAADTLVVGDTLRLSAGAADANGHAVAGAEFTWASSDASVAAVDAPGLVRGIAEGRATITATAGAASGTSEITVENPDRAVLVALYEATDGPNWVNSEEWLTDAPLEEWYGVDTDHAGRVVRLNLRGRLDDDTRQRIPHGLSGPIPPELGNLANLTTLSLEFNELTGPIPPELGNLANLTTLSLEFNELTGPIPDTFENLANLQVLNLWDNDLAGPLPPWLGTLSKLQYLYLGYAGRLTGPIPAEFGNLVNLERLSLHALPLGGQIPPELGNLSSLRVLQVGAAGLTGAIPPELGNLSNLTNLELGANELSGPIPAELGNLSNLVTIYAFSNRLSGPLPPELGKLSKLSDLVLSDNPLLVGPLPGTFPEMESLDYLILWGTGLCIPQTTDFLQWLRGFFRVEGENCAIVQESDREALEAIHRWTNGAGWRSNTNWLSEEPLNSWYGVTADTEDRVTALDLSDNNLTGILPGEAGNLLNLQDLVLSGNNALGGELPYRMLQLTALSTLRLDGTAVCASEAAVFQDWLGRIADARVTSCPDDHGNDASGATGVVVGEPVDGEIESYLDEDWFRVELGGRGTFSVAAKGNTTVHGELYDADGGRVGYDGSLGSFSIVRGLNAGTYYVRVTGQTEETRGAYTFVSSFEPRTPGARAYLTQAVQSHDFAVPLVAGEDALLRVFVMAEDGVTASMPPVLATFYRGGQEVHAVWIDGRSQQVPSTMAEGDLNATANAVVPGSVVLPGTEMVVEVDPDGTLDPSLGIGGRIPEEGRMVLDIRNMPDFDITAVPFLWTENPDSSGYKVAAELTAEHELFHETRDWLPVADIEVSVREAVLVDYDPAVNMGRVLDDIALLHAADGATGYYMGVPPWKTGGILGIAYLGSKVSVSRLNGRTIAHEFGHNFSLRHAPCGGPDGVDGRYPHSGGRIGTWGYDFRKGTLVDPNLHTDLMTYCRDNDWISDYSFAKAVEYRGGTQTAMASDAPGQVLVVRGGVEGGRLRIEPAFVLDAPPTLPERAGPYRLVGSDARGGELFVLRFDMQEIADAESEDDGGFTFAIPVRIEWAETLAAITLSGPAGSVRLVGDDPSAPTAALVLSPATGRIRAIFHDYSEQTVAADRTHFAALGAVTLVSRGIPAAEAWRR